MHTEDGKDQEAAMSFALASEVWRLRGIPMSPKVVLGRLAERANEKNQAWPTIELLAGDLGMSEATAMRAVAWLEKEGFITRQRGRYSTVYTIITGKLGEVESCLSEDTPCMVQPETLHGDSLDLAQCDPRPCMVQDRIVKNNQEQIIEESATPETFDSGKVANPDSTTSRQKKVRKVPTRQELIDHGSASEHFRSINVPLEVDKMLAWCSDKRFQPSKARLMNWLGRARPATPDYRNGGSLSQSATTEKDWAAECLPYDESSVLIDLSQYLQP